MLMVISPAKSLDFETPVHSNHHSQPGYLAQSKILVERLKTLSPADIAHLMGLSDALALLNFHRYADWKPPFTLANARQAVLAFDGDVYDGLAAKTMNDADLDFAQAHLRILSGLYGILKPLDLMQAYRLEMGSKLTNPLGKDLYAFWGERLNAAINAELAAMVHPVLVNLASEEYFKALQPKKLVGTVIQPVFEEWKGSQYKIISFFAKRARGLMARYAIVNRLEAPEGLLNFDSEGYAFAPEASDATTWRFRRRQS